MDAPEKGSMKRTRGATEGPEVLRNKRKESRRNSSKAGSLKKKVVVTPTAAVGAAKDAERRELSEEQENMLRKAFSLFDPQGTGKLTMSQVRDLLQTVDATSLDDMSEWTDLIKSVTIFFFFSLSSHTSCAYSLWYGGSPRHPSASALLLSFSLVFHFGNFFIFSFIYL